MPKDAPAQDFDLHVHFTGLCLFVEHEKGDKVTVVMPDARMPVSVSGKKKPHHDDGSEATPHVGYVAYDLANVPTNAVGITATRLGKQPMHEIIHQLDNADVDIGPGVGGPIDCSYLQLPKVNDFADVMELHQDVLKQKPRKRVLARVVLNGGDFMPPPPDGVTDWMFKGDLRKDEQDRPPYHLYGSSHWMATKLKGPGITLQIKPHNTGVTTQIPLVAMDSGAGRPTITLRFANLCARNNLEWDRFDPSTLKLAPGEEDNDFKWIYKLLQPGDDANYPAVPLPHPIPAIRGELQDCFGARIAITD